MVSDLKKKEILTVKELVDAYKNSIAEANKGLESITEKYKKLMEEEKKSLKEQLSESKSMLKTWEKMFNNFDVAVVKEVLGDDYNTDVTDTDSAEEVDVTDEAVVDTLFDQKSEEPEKADEVEEPVDNSASEQKSDSEKENDDIWEYGSDDKPADESEPEQKAEPEETDFWDESKIKDAPGPAIEDDDDDYPDLPDFSEWK